VAGVAAGGIGAVVVFAVVVVVVGGAFEPQADTNKIEAISFFTSTCVPSRVRIA
jgi:hypothetical protein